MPTAESHADATAACYDGNGTEDAAWFVCALRRFAATDAPSAVAMMVMAPSCVSVSYALRRFAATDAMSAVAMMVMHCQCESHGL